MNVRHFERGDRVDPISVAGEPFDIYSLGPIWCEVFKLTNAYLVPIMVSSKPGSGTLDTFLAALRTELPDKPIVFVNVINARLRPRLLGLGFGVLDL